MAHRRQQSIEEKLNIPVRDLNRFKTTNAKYAAFLDKQSDKKTSVEVQIEENEPTLTSIAIKRKKVKSIVDLANAIKKNSCLREVEIGGGGAMSEGIEALADMWADNRNLKSLTITFRKIETPDVDKIARAARVNKNITELALQFDSLNDEVMNDDGVEIVAQSFAVHGRFTSLGLNGAHIGPNGAVALVEAVRANVDLRTLNIAKCKLGADAALVAPVLSRWSSLQSLDLSDNNIGDEGAMAVSECLKSNTLLKKLNIHRNSIRKAGMVALSIALSQNNTLEELDVSDNAQPGVEGMQYVGIQKLIEVLYDNKSVKVLRMSRMKFSDTGMILIMKLLNRNAVLESLHLDNNILRDKGVIKLVDALENNTSLTSLDIYSNLVKEDGGLKLGEYLKTNASLKKIRLGGSDMKSGVDKILDALLTNTSLEDVSLTRSHLVGRGEQIAQVIKENSTLKHLNLESNKISDHGLGLIAEELKTNSTLSSLKFLGHVLNVGAAKAFAEAILQNTTLETLLLRTSPLKFSYKLSELGVQTLLDAVAENTNLRHFSMDCSSEGDAKIARIMKRNLNIIRKKYATTISITCSEKNYPLPSDDACLLIVSYCF